MLTFFVVQSGIISRLRDYKSLCAAVTICVTQLNIQTDSILATLYE